MSLPLSGLTVLDFTRLLPGGFCTMTLADMGAEIIKVEEPRIGDYTRAMPPMAGGQSVYFLALNRNKKSLTLDLKAPAAQEIVDRLVEKADVLVESGRPGVVDRLGIGYARVHARNPRLVYGSITGFGQDGPYRAHAGHDLTYVALAGMLAIDRDEKEPRPRMPRMFLADIGGGALSAVAGILAGLVQAQRSGQGPHVDVSMMEGVLNWLSFPAARQLVRDEAIEPGDLPLSGREACYNLYRTRDGGYMALGILEPKFWQAFCERIGRPDLIPLQYGHAATQQRVRDELDRLFATRTRAEWVEGFGDAEVCCAPVNTVAEALADPHVRARGTVETVDDPHAGRMQHIRSAIRFRGEGRVAVVPAPRLGQHTDEILARLGYDAAAIRRLRADGSV